MVEHTLQLDQLFHSLADATRRDILRRVCRAELNISDLAHDYSMTFAAVAKHLKVLEKANLIVKRRQGNQQIIAAQPETIALAAKHIEEYKRYMNERYDTLDELLKQ